MNKPNFTKFSYEELLQAERSIKRDMNPGYYEEVTELLSKYPNTEEEAKPKWKRFDWRYFAVATPSLYLLLAYSLISERVWGRRWIYESDDPMMYWFVICIYIVCSVIATDRLYVTWHMREKVKSKQSH